MKMSMNTDANRIALRRETRAKISDVTADDWQRIFAMKLTDADRDKLRLLKPFMDRGEVQRKATNRYTATGRPRPFSKSEALELAVEVQAKIAESKREERMVETIRTKPDNYRVITDDTDLPMLMERIHEEVRLQQNDPWFRKVFDLFNHTLIREKLLESNIEIPLVSSFTEWDTETSGTDTRIDMTGGYSFWLPLLREGYYVAYGHLTKDPQCTRSKALGAIKSFISDAKQIKSFHNTTFDYAMMLNDKMKPVGFRYDSMDAMQILNEHEETFKLKELAHKYKYHIGADHLDDFTFEDLFGDGSPLIYSPEIVGIYAIKDVEKGWLLTKWQIDMLLKCDDLYYPYFQIRQYLYEVNVTIERTGFEIDLQEMKQLENEFEPKLEQALHAIYDTYQIDDKFLYDMSMTINGDRIESWCTNRERQIAKQNEMLASCKEQLVDVNPETKKYQQLKDRIERYETNPLDPPSPDNAPDFIHEFNLDSDKHRQYLLYDVLKIEDKSHLFDKQRKRLVNKKVMDLYYRDVPELKPMAEYSKLSTLLGTFVKKIPNALDMDGRLHTRLSTVSTGRYSSKGYTGKANDLYRDDITDDNFIAHMNELVHADKAIEKGTNVQNIPARSSEGERVRMTFKPPKGWTFIGSDLSSIEPRIQAHRMATEFGDDSFAEMYRKGFDPYVEFAAILFEVPKEICLETYYKSVKGTADEVPAYRKAMKQMFLARGYGQAFDMFYKGVLKFGIGEQQARKAYDTFDDILPGFGHMVDVTFEHLRKHGWTATIFKQKRRFPGYVDKWQRLCRMMRRCGIRDKNDPDLGKKSRKLPWKERSEFWELIKFTGRCERQGFNHTIQGSGANILQMCMIRNYYEFVIKRGFEFCLTLHDELKNAVPNDKLTPDIIHVYNDIMRNTFSLALPIKCDTVIETKWMDEYSEDEWDFEHCKPGG
jgi:DNA polymerase-1